MKKKAPVVIYKQIVVGVKQHKVIMKTDETRANIFEKERKFLVKKRKI